MRRPVKPFVTEYKAPNRRPQSPTGPSAPTTGQSAPKGPSARRLREDVAKKSPSWTEGLHRSNGGEHAEDAYEAAMRAADALFAPSPRKVATSSASEPLRVFVGDEDEGGTDADTKAGGRVLRAIDEKPSIELVAMEVERAPKRRGRKPGSKNKPKVSSVEIPSGGAMPSYTFMDDDEDTLDETEVTEDVDAGDDVSAPMLPPAEKPVHVSRSPAPYSWVRRKLAPGEEWKRRLPKVCW